MARGPGGLPRDFLGPPGGLLGASWGLLETSWGTSGGLWAALWRRGRFLIAFWAHVGVSKSLNVPLNFALSLNIDSDSFFCHLEASGGHLGLDFWPFLDLILGSPGREAGFLNIVVPLRAGA